MNNKIKGHQSAHEFVEKRHINRLHLIYYLRVYDGISSRVVGHAADISQHGLMLISDVPVDVHEEFRFRMRFPGKTDEQEELIFNAVCRWCRQDDNNAAFYLVGFQIQDLLPDDALFIQSLIDEFSV